LNAHQLGNKGAFPQAGTELTTPDIARDSPEK